jgi:hypothetical protein
MAYLVLNWPQYVPEKSFHNCCSSRSNTFDPGDGPDPEALLTRIPNFTAKYRFACVIERLEVPTWTHVGPSASHWVTCTGLARFEQSVQGSHHAVQIGMQSHNQCNAMHEHC